MVLLRYLDFCTRCVTARMVVEQPLRVFDWYSTGVLSNRVERRGELLTATNGKIDEGRKECQCLEMTRGYFVWNVLSLRYLRPPIAACVYIHGRIVHGLRKLHKFTRVLKSVLSSLIR